MKDGFIVVRKEKHLDDKYWVCEDKIDALRIASDVTDYWMDKYLLSDPDVEMQSYDDQIFRRAKENSFCVTVAPQKIRSTGEYQQEKP